MYVGKGVFKGIYCVCYDYEDDIILRDASAAILGISCSHRTVFSYNRNDDR